jgi:hypothetical protein
MNANMSGPRRFLIEERFHITGRGAVVVIGETTELPVGKALRVTITRPDSSQLTTEAFKEWLLRREQRPLVQRNPSDAEIGGRTDRYGLTRIRTWTAGIACSAVLPESLLQLAPWASCARAVPRSPASHRRPSTSCHRLRERFSPHSEVGDTSRGREPRRH